MVHFVGLDVSVKETSVCVVDDAGKVIFEQKVLTEPAGVCTTARDSAMASVEVLVGPERRRRWSIEQKQSIVAAAFEPGAVVRDVARQADVTPSLIYRWRRDLRAAANSFAQVLVAPAGDGAAILPVAVIEIEFGGNAQVRIPASVSPALAAAVVEALARR